MTGCKRVHSHPPLGTSSYWAQQRDPHKAGVLVTALFRLMRELKCRERTQGPGPGCRKTGARSGRGSHKQLPSTHNHAPAPALGSRQDHVGPTLSSSTRQGELAHPTPTVGVPGEPHGRATRAGQPGMSAQVGCGVGGPAPGACQRWATGHHEVGVQAVSSTAGGMQAGQVSQLLTFSERETGIGNSPVGLGRGREIELSPRTPSGHPA